MVTETTKLPNFAGLMPERYQEDDLFICDVSDAVLKDLTEMMEHPFYSLSKKPETEIREYRHNGNWLRIIPSHKGLVTIYDKDILIYCISQIVAKLNRGEPVHRRVRINTCDLLRFTNRGTSGRDYEAISDALSRLSGTSIETNIRVGDEEEFSTFHLVDSGSIRRKHGLDGRLLYMEISVSDWVFDAIRDSAVLTLHRDYFRLRKPLERRVYELARKHCGQQASWKCSVELLHKKSGSKSPRKHFRYLLKELAENDHLPDYRVRLDGETDQVYFTNRRTMPLPSMPGEVVRPLRAGIEDEARAAAPGYDPHFLEMEWRGWLTEPPRDPNAAFLGFCRAYYRRHGPPR